jgi:hypothetical protein
MLEAFVLISTVIAGSSLIFFFGKETSYSWGGAETPQRKR